LGVSLAEVDSSQLLPRLVLVVLGDQNQHPHRTLKGNRRRRRLRHGEHVLGSKLGLEFNRLHGSAPPYPDILRHFSLLRQRRSRNSYRSCTDERKRYSPLPMKEGRRRCHAPFACSCRSVFSPWRPWPAAAASWSARAWQAAPRPPATATTGAGW